MFVFRLNDMLLFLLSDISFYYSIICACVSNWRSAIPLKLHSGTAFLLGNMLFYLLSGTVFYTLLSNMLHYLISGTLFYTR